MPTELINNFMYSNKIFMLTDLQKAYYMGEYAGGYLSGLHASMTIAVDLEHLELSKFKTAIIDTVNRHDMLRAVVINEQQGTILNYCSSFNIDIMNADSEEALDNIYAKIAKENIDVHVFPYFRFTLVSYRHIKTLIFKCSLFFLDASSIHNFISEVIARYNLTYQYTQLEDLTFSEFSIRYSSKSSKEYLHDLEYWKCKNIEHGRLNTLPINQVEHLIKTPQFSHKRSIIKYEIWTKLKNRCKQNHVSVTTVCASIYALILMKWSGLSNVAINIVASYRNKPKAQLGNYGNPFPLSVRLNNKNIRIADFFHNISETLREDIKHQNCPISDIVGTIKDKLDRNTPSFPFVFTPIFKFDESFGLSNIENGKFRKLSSATAKVWIDCIILKDVNNNSVIRWDYVDQLFERRVIEEMHSDYCSLIEYLAEADWEHDSLPELKLPDFDQQVIESANSASQPLSEETLFGYYENNVCLNYPEQLARISVVDYSKGNAQEFSYARLLDDSSLLARYIYSLLQNPNPTISGVSNCSKVKKDLNFSLNTLESFTQQTSIQTNNPTCLIGVLVEKNYYQVVSALAIMKAGCAYLPLNVDWPLRRIGEVLAQGSCEYVLVSKEQSLKNNNLVELKSLGYKVIVIEDMLEQLTSNDKESQGKQNQHNTNILTNIKLPQISADDVAYVIFTSGSTGVPKGVTISHRGALNTILAVNNKYSTTSSDCVLALSELSFDLSVYDIFGMLCCGGKIVFPEQARTKEPDYWIELINQHNVTIWNTVPQLADLLVDEANSNYDYIGSLRLFLLSGDWIPLNLPKKIKSNVSKVQVVSLGGATEGSIWSIWYDVDEVHEDWESIPYGKAMPNQKIYILNIDNQACPIGVIGEIHIGGVGVALNYWGDERKTANSYFVHPELGRLYKTGDLGCWNKCGYIEFKGRKDSQVKVNGYRIELGEISARLSKLPGVDSSLVTAQENKLVGYLISERFKVKESSVNYQSFKLEQKGILKTLDSTYKLTVQFDEDKYKLRKSYRKFASKVDINGIDITTLSCSSGKSLVPAKITQLNLSKLLSPLSGITIKDRVLPKYLYPSAGSCYAIRAFINIPANTVDGILPGVYYYHPLDNTLQYVDQSTSREFSIEFRLHLPSMEPLYGNETERLAYLELGHILQLLDSQYQLSYEILDSANDEYLDLVRVSFGNTIKSQAQTINIAIEKIVNCDNKFKEFDLKQQPITLQASELGAILNCSSGVLAISGDQTPASYIEAGYQAQAIAAQLYDMNIGSCTLGFNLNKNSIYIIALGGITDEQKQLSEVNADVIILEDIIKNTLKIYLPEYMIPDFYITLDKLPLTINGKVDYKQLPSIELSSDYSYVAPRTILEKSVCKIYAELLGLDITCVGIKDNFFKLGGNSILAIKLISNLNKLLNGVTIQDLYKHKTIELLIENKPSINEIEVKGTVYEF